jgi:hypothetical protein
LSTNKYLTKVARFSRNGPTKSLGIAALALAALTIVSLPTFAAPASQHYQVASDKDGVLAGGSVAVTSTIKQATPDCAYSVQLSVSGPGGVSATDSVTVTTQGGGDGNAAASFPSDFSGTANTNAPGTYTVSATFTCGYATGRVSGTFYVKSGHNDE